MGAMGVPFAAAIVSGLIVCGPFMRKLDLALVRRKGGSRLGWLDPRNPLGAVTLAWAPVVDATGAIDTLATPLQQKWQADALAAFAADYAGKPAPAALASLDAAAARVKAALPETTPAFASFPKSPARLRSGGSRAGAAAIRGDAVIALRLI